MINRRIAGERTRRQFTGLSNPFEDAGVGAGFLDRHLHLIAAVGDEFDHHRVRFIGQIAIRVRHLQENLIARLHMILRSSLRAAIGLAVLLLLFTSQLLGECFFLFIDDLLTGHLEASVRGDLDFDIAERNGLELLLELVRVVALDLILAGELQNLVSLLDLTERRFQVHAEQPFARAAAGQIDDLFVAAGDRSHDDRNLVVSAADAEIAVLHDDRQRLPRRVEPLARSAEASNCAEQIELIHVSLFRAVNFREIEQRLIGQLDVRNSIEHGAEDFSRFVLIAAPMREHAAQEFGSYDDFGFAAGREFLEDSFRLIVNLLSHERLTDAKLRFG